VLIGVVVLWESDGRKVIGKCSGSRVRYRSGRKREQIKEKKNLAK
jgi:hypothetical protein